MVPPDPRRAPGDARHNGGMADDGVFSGLRVLDLTEGFAGALCTMVLGDNGAAVIRVAPREEDEQDPIAGLPAARQWHRSKDVRRIDVSADDGRAAVEALLREADIVVASSDGVVVRDVGISAGGARAADPRLIYCTIDGFGDHPTLSGLKGYEGVVTAAAGRMVDMGYTLGLYRPAIVGPPLAGYGAAQAALHGICAALWRRMQTGHGDEVRASLLRAISMFDYTGPEGRSLGTAGNPTRLPPPDPSAPPPRRPEMPPLFYIPARTKDGRWLQWCNWARHLFWQQAELLGFGELKDDERFAGLPNQAFPAAGNEIWERTLEATAERTAEEWMAMLTERGTVGGDIFMPTRAGMDHPQVRHNGDVIEVDDPAVGPTEQIGPMVHMGATPTRVGMKPWADARGVLGTAAANGKAPTTRPPLDGVLLLEAATMIATPTGGVALSDMGARVIKIEPLEGDPGRSLPFLKMVQGKESICVNLRTPEGVAVVHKLVAKADMFLHNYRPGVPKRLGIDWDTLRAINPRLVYLYAGAYGIDGPYSKMPGYHPIAGAVCGNATQQAGDGALDDTPGLTMDELKARSLRLIRANEGHPDAVTGLAAATGLLMGLIARDRYGVGQDITTSLLTANAYLMSDDWIRYDGCPTRDVVDGDVLGTGPLNRLYETAAGWVFLACLTPWDWSALCGLLDGRELGSDGRFATAEQRRANAAALAAVLENAFADRSADEWEAAAAKIGLGCVRADRMSWFDFQQAEIVAGRRQVCVPASSPGVGDHWRASAIVDMDSIGELGGASLAGQQTVPILQELGYRDDEISRLIDTEIVRAAG